MRNQVGRPSGGYPCGNASSSQTAEHFRQVFDAWHAADSSCEFSTAGCHAAIEINSACSAGLRTRIWKLSRDAFVNGRFGKFLGRGFDQRFGALLRVSSSLPWAMLMESEKAKPIAQPHAGAAYTDAAD